MATYQFNIIEQTDFYPSLQWEGLSNLSAEDAFIKQNLLKGNVAHSGSIKKANNLYVTERIVFKSTDPIPLGFVFDDIILTIKARSNIKPSSRQSVQAVVYFSTNDNIVKNVVLKSFIVSDIFEKQVYIIKPVLPLGTYNLGARLEIEFQSSGPFEVDVDYIAVNTSLVFVSETVSLASQTVTFEQGFLDTKIDIKTVLPSLEISLEPGELQTLEGNKVQLTPLEMNVSIGELATIAPDTWSVWGSGGSSEINNSIGILLFTIQNEFSTDEFHGGVWLSSDSTVFNSYENIIIPASNSADLQIADWSNFDSTNQTIITIDSENSAEFTISANNAWDLFGILGISAYRQDIIIAVPDDAEYDDAQLQVWMSALFGTFVTFSIFATNNAAFEDPYSSPNSIDYNDIDLVWNFSAANSWDLWDNHPRYKTIDFGIDEVDSLLGVEYTSSQGYTWTQNFAFGYQVITTTLQNTALQEDPYSSPNVVDYNDMNLEGWPSHPNVWMTWDNHPSYENVGIFVIEDFNVDVPYSSPNVVDYNDMNLEGWPSHPNVWMTWDNHPSYENVGIFVIEDFNVDVPYSSPNVVDYHKEVDLTGWPSASNAWLMWDNQPKPLEYYMEFDVPSELGIVYTTAIGMDWVSSLFNHDNIDIFIDVSALNTHPYSSPNVIDYNDMNLEGWPSVPSSAIWMRWDNHPSFDIVEIATTNDFVVETPYTHPNVVDYHKEVDLTGWPTASNAWFVWDNQPKFHEYTIVSIESAQFVDVYTSAVGVTWVSSEFSFLPIVMATTDSASQDVPYSSPNVVDYHKEVDLTGWPSALNDWMIWDNQPEFWNIDIFITNTATTDIDASAESPWLLWDGSKDSPFFPISDNDVNANAVYDVEMMDYNKALVSYVDSGSVRVFGIRVSSYEVRITPETTIHNEITNSVDIVRTQTSTKAIVGYVNVDPSAASRVYQFVEYVSADSLNILSFTVDTAASGTSYHMKLEESEPGVVFEYSYIDTAARIRTYAVDVSTDSLSILQTNSVIYTDNISYMKKVKDRVIPFNFSGDVNVARTFDAQAMAIRSTSVTGFVPGGIGSINEGSGYIVFSFHPSFPGQLRYTVFDLGPSNEPLYVTDDFVSTSAEFSHPNRVEVVTTSSRSYVIFAGVGSDIYMKAVTLADDAQHINLQTGWNHITSSAANAPIIAHKFTENGNRILLVFKHEDGKLVAKIMEA